MRDIVRTPRSQGFAARAVALGVITSLIAAGCSVTGPAATTSAAPCLVGAAWNNYTEERISLWDEPPIQKVVEKARGIYEFKDAKSSPDTQRTQIDEFLAKGAKVMIIRVQGDGEVDVPLATRRAIERVADAGVAVIAYEYFVDSPRVLWINFDSVETGRVEARAMLAARPKGNYVILRGHQGQAVEDQLASGIHEVLQPAVDTGDIKIVAEPYIHWWDPGVAQTEMEQILIKNDNKIDAVIAESDGMANGATAALKAAGLTGKVAVAGQGGDYWSLNNVAAGLQTVDVWPDLRLMGKAAGDAAVALCQHPDVSKLTGTTLFSSPSHNQVPSILLTPQAITQDNLSVLLDAGWIKTKADLCRSVDDPSRAAAVCR